MMELFMGICMYDCCTPAELYIIILLLLVDEYDNI